MANEKEVPGHLPLGAKVEQSRRRLKTTKLQQRLCWSVYGLVFFCGIYGVYFRRATLASAVFLVVGICGIYATSLLASAQIELLHLAEVLLDRIGDARITDSDDDVVVVNCNYIQIAERCIALADDSNQYYFQPIWFSDHLRHIATHLSSMAEHYENATRESRTRYERI